MYHDFPEATDIDHSKAQATYRSNPPFLTGTTLVDTIDGTGNTIQNAGSLSFTHPKRVHVGSFTANGNVNRMLKDLEGPVRQIHENKELVLPAFSHPPRPPSAYACQVGFTSAQIRPAMRILQHLKAQRTEGESDTTPVPDELMTSELVEIRDGWGWCLIGTCGIARHTERAGFSKHADTKANNSLLSLDPSEGRGNVWSRRRADMLYAHIRKAHLRYRPFWCKACLKRFYDQIGLDEHRCIY